MSEKPRIICAGVLNTKGEEIKFLANKVKEAGGTPLILDLSLGEESQWADIPLGEVLQTTGTMPEEVFALDRTSAMEVVGRAAAEKMRQLHGEGKVDGIIAWSGGVGTSVATTAMRALPIGVPKIMLSTLASGDVSNWVGNKDIYMVNPISEKGINRVTQRIVSNAAAAIVAMGQVDPAPAGEVRPLVALTAYGTTTPTVVRCQKHMEEQGWDTIVIHQVGTGATMEDLIRSRHITAVFDITTGELSNTLLGSPFGMPATWDGLRLTAAAKTGIPQIVCPGGLDQAAFGPAEHVPDPILSGYRNGKRRSYKNSGAPFPHNAAVSIVSLSDEEIETLATQIIERLNNTTGPTALVVPMRGWSAYDQPASVATTARGWSKQQGDAPLWEPAPQNEAWTRRAVLMYRVFRDKINEENDHLDLIPMDMHILDEGFGDFLNRCMDDMLGQRWHKGMYRNHTSFVVMQGG